MIKFKKKLDQLPNHPGVYIMKDKIGQVLYVGKAKNIKKRVGSYFQGGSSVRRNNKLSPKTKILVTKIAKIEPTVVGNEVEALVLENELIKKYRPPFNVVMRDDKNYLYIKITVDEDFPQILLVRQVMRDKARYFGPFVDSKSVRGTLRLIHKIFPLCTAGSRRVGRACLNYHLGICPGVCLGKTESSEYQATIHQVVDFLSGRFEDVLKTTAQKMSRLAKSKKFEQAARLRDAIVAVRKISQRQKIVTTDLKTNQDIIGVARQLNQAVIVLFQVRAGKLVNQLPFVMESKYESETEDILRGFIRDYYGRVAIWPKEILLSQPVKNLSVLNRWLSGLADHKVVISVPRRGRKRQFAKLADKNAGVKFGELSSYFEIDKKIFVEGVKKLKILLKLKRLNRIEAYDISNTQGSDAVGSMVVFEKGKMDNQQYRRFKIKSVTGPNDFASLAEVLRRRFTKLGGDPSAHLAGSGQAGSGSKQDQGFGKTPDLVLIDGGKGQVSAVKKVLSSIPIIGMVKGSHSAPKAKDDVVVGSKILILSNNSPAKMLLQRIRDEAHRFALSYHVNLRRRRVTKSRLDSISGVGNITRKKLLKKFGSLAAIQRASIQDIAKIVGEKKAQTIKASI